MTEAELLTWESEFAVTSNKEKPDDLCLIWKDKVPVFDKKKPYLWRREKLIFTNGAIKHSKPYFLGDYSPKTFSDRLYNFIYKHFLNK